MNISVFLVATGKVADSKIIVKNSISIFEWLVIGKLYHVAQPPNNKFIIP